MRLSPNLHVGVALGIATAGVILALTGCVAGTTAGSAAPGPDATANGQRGAGPALEQFSETERERILAVQDIVEQASRENGVDPTLINAVIWVESRFEPKAKSKAGARGLMQLMPATAAYLAKRMGEHSPHAYDPEFNVRAGTLYLAQMIEKFGDEGHAVAAYHAGPGNVKRWLESGTEFPDYSQTYVAKVMEARGRFDGVETHGRPSGSAIPVVGVEAKPGPSKSSGPSKSPGPVSESEPEPEPMLAPEDIDSLPDAAEIHGVARVVHVQPEPEPEPVSEPVFEPHPELDANPDASTGWSPRRNEAARKPKREPEPPVETEPPSRTEHPRQAEPPPSQAEPPAKSPPKSPPESPPEDEAGIGILPDL